MKSFTLKGKIVIRSVFGKDYFDFRLKEIGVDIGKVVRVGFFL